MRRHPGLAAIAIPAALLLMVGCKDAEFQNIWTGVSAERTLTAGAVTCTYTERAVELDVTDTFNFTWEGNLEGSGSTPCGCQSTQSFFLGAFTWQGTYLDYGGSVGFNIDQGVTIICEGGIDDSGFSLDMSYSINRDEMTMSRNGEFEYRLVTTG